MILLLAGVWIMTWMAGIYVCERLLGLDGYWLMLGGYITGAVCSAIDAGIRAVAEDIRAGR